VPTRPYQERIDPRLLGKRSCANKQTSIGLYGTIAKRLPAVTSHNATLAAQKPSAFKNRVWLAVPNYLD
jgi:hypothetical protein